MINAEIDRMLQEEENDLYAEYMKDPEFAAHMKNENEKMALTERISALEAENFNLKRGRDSAIQQWSSKCEHLKNEPTELHDEIKNIIEWYGLDTADDTLEALRAIIRKGV